MSKTTFKMSAELQDLIKDCDNLNFDWTDSGNIQTSRSPFLAMIEAAEVTPKDTGYTQEHNEIWRQGKRVIVGNTNTEYGEDIYYNPWWYEFNRGQHKPTPNGRLTPNKNAREHWLEDSEFGGTEKTTQLFVDGIQDEIDNRLRK